MKKKLLSIFLFLNIFALQIPVVAEDNYEPSETSGMSQELNVDEDSFLDDIADQVEDVHHEKQELVYSPKTVAVMALASLQYFIIDPLANTYCEVSTFIANLFKTKKDNEQK